MKRLLTASLVPACFFATLAFGAEPAPMHERMQQMRDTMAAIHAEADPARRAELQREHHAMMRANMDTMERDDDTANLSLEERVTRLEERSAMMHMMMGQMMDMQAPADTGAGATDPAHEHGD